MRTVRIEEYTKITSGFAFKSDEFSESRGIPIVRIRDVKRGYTETYYTGKYDPVYIVETGDVLIGMDGEFNVAKWRGGKALLNQRVCKIETEQSKLHQDYLYFFLPKSLKKIENQTPSVTVKHLSVKKIKDIEIPLPQISEQKHIATILNKANAMRRKRQQVIQLADEFLRSVFLDMFGDPIRNTKNFPVKPLGELASIKRGRFSPRPRNDPRYYGGNYPFIQTGDINECDSLLLNWKQTLNEDGTKVSYSFEKNTVLIAIVGATIGATAILGFKSYAPDSVIGIVPKNENLTAEYLEYSLRFWRPVFLMRAPQTARANINIGTLKPLGLPTPDFELQKIFSSLYRTILKLKRRYHCFADDLFNSLSQRAFRGEL